MRRIYLAGRFSRQDELRFYGFRLRQLGATVDARWLDQEDGDWDVEDIRAGSLYAIEMGRRRAAEDLKDLGRSNMLLSFTENDDAEDRTRTQPPDGMTEEWRPIPFSALGYEVSNFGRVRNGEGETIAGKKSNGYLRVQPSGRSGRADSVHGIVAALFIGPCPEGREIDHLDGYKDNNWAGNLEYVTHAENVARAAARMTGGPHAGARNGRAKLTEDDVASIRARAKDGDSKAAIARDFDVSDVLIGKVVRGELWPQAPEPDDGSRHVEFGAARWLGLTLAIVGPRENVFHCAEDVAQFDDFEAFIESDYLRGWLRSRGLR